MFTDNKRKMVYVPDRMGRLGQGTWVEERDPFGRVMEPVEKEKFDFSNPFELTQPVGRRGRNDWKDVAKVENLLGQTGHLDLRQTDGPTGYFGTRTEQAVKGFQKEKGLREDGLLTPGGPTLKALEGRLAPREKQAVRAGKENAETLRKMSEKLERDGHGEQEILKRVGLYKEFSKPGQTAESNRAASLVKEGLDPDSARKIAKMGAEETGYMLELLKENPSGTHPFFQGFTKKDPKMSKKGTDF